MVVATDNILTAGQGMSALTYTTRHMAGMRKAVNEIVPERDNNRQDKDTTPTRPEIILVATTVSHLLRCDVSTRLALEPPP